MSETQHAESAEADLLRATSAFAVDSAPRSWTHTWVALALLAAFEVAVIFTPWWPVRLLGALAVGGMLVRIFVIYHDVMHGAILRGSKVARGLFWTLGLLLLTPVRSWRKSHNFHHGHVGQLAGSSTGSFPILTTDAWNAASRSTRLGYRLARHPLTIALAYLTVFVYSICLRSLFESPRRHWDSALALVVHVALVVGIAITAGMATMAFTTLIPIAIACAVGAYLFYVQHNFVGVKVLAHDRWSFTQAALASSSYLELGPVMRFVTANIGYHHVHHLNPHIPFYRLPATMAALPPLRRKADATLRFSNILACLRLKLWDPRGNRMVTFRDLRERAPHSPGA